MIRLLVTGALGLLGGWVVRAARSRPLHLTTWNGSGDVPFTDARRVEEALREARPDVILHLAAMARVDACERSPDLARRINADVVGLLAGTPLVFVSTDMVFDGEAAPYSENALPSASTVYGRTKAEGELHADTVVRLPLLIGPSIDGRPSFFAQQVHDLRDGKAITLHEDEWRTPLDLPFAAEALLDLALERPGGIWHLAGPERLSRYEIGAKVAQALGASSDLLRAVPRPAGRARDLSLDPSKWRTAFPRSPWRSLGEALPALLK